MIPGINPRDLKQAMKKMGMIQEDIPATRAVIYSEGKTLVIENPAVAKVTMMGEETYQITGTAQWVETQTQISDQDIETVQESAECSKEEAEEALKNTKGDIAEAILKISQKQKEEM
ncbi:nascent polypeptide-associated complex protein [Candidatus Woesearchaeota archaeon]|nr:nascent polypeptide-associated complex protein [Candidatus Woesearchaeota archaeon]